MDGQAKTQPSALALTLPSTKDGAQGQPWLALWGGSLSSSDWLPVEMAGSVGEGRGLREEIAAQPQPQPQQQQQAQAQRL